MGFPKQRRKLADLLLALGILSMLSAVVRFFWSPSEGLVVGMAIFVVGVVFMFVSIIFGSADARGGSVRW